MKILIAEDEVFLREVYASILESVGYQVQTAEDGKRALELLENNYYDLVITDIMMPKLNGIEMLKKYAPNRKKQGKIIVLSSIVNSCIPMLRELDIDGYFCKADITQEQFVEIVGIYLHEESNDKIDKKVRKVLGKESSRKDKQGK